MLVSILAQAAAVAAPQQGVISYPASYFAAQAPANAAEMISRVPGFTLDSGASVRGFEGAAGNVLIDGQRPASKSDDLDAILRRLPASTVERIDVIRGGAPGIDMQGKTVIANIVRKAGGGFRGLAAVAVDGLPDGRRASTARAEMSGDLGVASWEIGALGGRFLDDGFGVGPGLRVDLNGARTPVRIEGEGDGLNGQFTGAIEGPILGGKLRTNGRIFREKYKGEELDRLLGPVPSAERTLDVNHAREKEVSADFSRRLGPKSTLEVVGLFQSEQRDTASDFSDGQASAYRNHRETREIIGRSVLKHRASPRLSLEVGGELAVNNLDSATHFTVNGAPITLRAANVQVQEDRGEVFAKSAWRPSDNLSIDASLRYEHSKVSSTGDVVLGKTLQFIKPRLAVTWAPNASRQVRLRFEREVGQLNFNDFVASANIGSASGVVTGNPDLDPEQAWVAEGAFEQRFRGSGSLTLIYRHFELSDVVDRGPVFTSAGDFVSDRPANIGAGTKDSLGLEYSLPLERLGLKRATIKGDVTKRWTRVTDPTTHFAREISGLHPISWSVHLSHDVPDWKISYGFDAFGA
jgi:outer membrane receptor protein involved in Fe transport